MNFDAVPHAVFTLPQIASIGMTEAQASQRHEILVGQARYADTAQSDVRMESQGFAKVIVEKGTERILGFHIIGPDAAILIQSGPGGDAKGQLQSDNRGHAHLPCPHRVDSGCP